MTLPGRSARTKVNGSPGSRDHTSGGGPASGASRAGSSLSPIESSSRSTCQTLQLQLLLELGCDLGGPRPISVMHQTRTCLTMPHREPSQPPVNSWISKPLATRHPTIRLQRRLLKPEPSQPRVLRVARRLHDFHARNAIRAPAPAITTAASEQSLSLPRPSEAGDRIGGDDPITLTGSERRRAGTVAEHEPGTIGMSPKQSWAPRPLQGKSDRHRIHGFRALRVSRRRGRDGRAE